MAHAGVTGDVNNDGRMLQLQFSFLMIMPVEMAMATGIAH